MPGMMCPKCGEVLIEEIYETSFDNDTYIDFSVGDCPKCRKTFRWETKYTLEGVENFQEVGLDE